MGAGAAGGGGTGATARPGAARSGVGAGGKVVPLAEAIRRHVRPGMVIQAGNGWGHPTALLWEIVRQFWGRDPGPGFTLVVAGATSTDVVPFLRGGLVRRVVSSFAGDGYPHPGPNPVIQEARQAWAAARGSTGGGDAEPRAGTAGRAGGPTPPAEFEDWSLLTFTLRLMAGAMGVPYLPTRSLLGSDLGRDLEAAGLFRVVEESGGPVGLVKALRPDIALAHAWAADAEGNALFTMPLAGNLYGALAAREGVIVSVERVVPRPYIAANSDLMRLPADRVLAVVEAPFGAHPTGLHRHGAGKAGGPPDAGETPEMSPAGSWGYAEDRDFILEVREACRDHGGIDRWIRRWILDLPDHGAYLGQLGADRLVGLEQRLAPAAWMDDLPPGWIAGGGLMRAPRLEVPDTPLTSGERLIGLAAGVVADEIRRGGYPLVLAGVGAAHLACWLAREDLAHEGRTVDLMAEIGLVGHTPCPGDPFVFALRNVPSALMTSDVPTVLGMMVPRHCLGAIGAAQVDRWGNVNSSGAPAAGMWLVGSGGANDVASTAEAVVVVAAQSAARFVPEVPYITSPGHRVAAIVSQWGLFRREGPGGEFALAGYYDDPADPGVEAGVRRAREKCGWDLRVLPDPLPLPPPGPDLVRRMRLFDPHGSMRA